MGEIDDGRRLLLLSAAGSLTPLLVGSAQADGPSSDHHNLVVTPQPIAAGTAPSTQFLQAAYGDLKKLCKQANAWNPTFDTSYLAGAAPQLKEIAEQEKQKLHHNRRLVEPLLGEISALVDRCIAYRKEGANLELQGVSAGISKYLAYTLDDGDLAQSRIDPSYAMSVVLADKYGSASKTMRDDPSNKAAQLQLDALSLANGKFAELQAQRVSWQSGRLKQVQDIGRKLIGRYDTEGNAHNFAQRFDRVRRLFQSDIASAYRRAIAAREGLKMIFEFSDDANFPDPDNPKMLDNFVQWTRNAMRAVALIGETEIEFTRQFTLEFSGQPLAIGKPQKMVEVDLEQEIGIKYLRLRAVGATFTYDGDPIKDSNKTSAIFRVVLLKGFTPLSGEKLDGREPRVVIPLNNVKAEGASVVPDYVTGAALYNVNPNGQWDYRIGPHWSNHTGYHTFMEQPFPSWLKRIQIYMQLVGAPDPSRDRDWWTTEDRVY